jgi:hypothetical protein
MPRPCVAQEELDTVIGIENQIRALVNLYNRKTNSILTRMQEGATVEVGTHTAYIEEEMEGPCQKLQLVVR